jgi:hypothetical protein
MYLIILRTVESPAPKAANQKLKQSSLPRPSTADIVGEISFTLFDLNRGESAW